MNVLNDCDLDIDDTSQMLKSKKDSVVDRMKTKELLRYGAIITEHDVEFVMDLKKLDMSLDQWQFVKLQLREIIKSEGFYVSSRGRENDLYILQPYEMPMYNEKKNKANFRNLKQRSRGLHMIDDSILSKEHQKKLEFEILRNAHFEVEMSKSLGSRCRY